METLDTCPVCEGSKFKDFLSAKDYTVSQEEFQIVECEDCHFRFTNPRPDQEGIAAYYKAEAYISHTNTKKGLMNSAYHRVRKITLKQKFNLVKEWTNGNSLLDVGAGAGAFLAHCKSKGWDVLGLEPDPDARKVALDDFGVVEEEISELKNLPDNSRDAITMWHVLEHVHELRNTIAHLKRVLKQEGALFIAVPNCSSKDAETYGAGWAAYDVPRHLYHFRPDDIKTLFAGFDLDLVSVRPMKFDAYYVAMLSEKYRGGGMVKGVLNGWRSNLSANNTRNDYSSEIYILKHKKA